MAQFRVNPKLDTNLEVLKSSSCRGILYGLEDAGSDVLQLNELVDAELAGNPDAMDREEVTASFYHTELPKLAEMDWIEYDFRSGSVRYRPENVPITLLRTIRIKESPPVEVGP